MAIFICAVDNEICNHCLLRIKCLYLLLFGMQFFELTQYCMVFTKRKNSLSRFYLCCYKMYHSEGRLTHGHCSHTAGVNHSCCQETGPPRCHWHSKTVIVHPDTIIGVKNCNALVLLTDTDRKSFVRYKSSCACINYACARCTILANACHFITRKLFQVGCKDFFY